MPDFESKFYTNTDGLALSHQKQQNGPCQLCCASITVRICGECPFEGAVANQWNVAHIHSSPKITFLNKRGPSMTLHHQLHSKAAWWSENWLEGQATVAAHSFGFLLGGTFHGTLDWVFDQSGILLCVRQQQTRAADLHFACASTYIFFLHYGV